MKKIFEIKETGETIQLNCNSRKSKLKITQTYNGETKTDKFEANGFCDYFCCIGMSNMKRIKQIKLLSNENITATIVFWTLDPGSSVQLFIGGNNCEKPSQSLESKQTDRYITHCLTWLSIIFFAITFAILFFFTYGIIIILPILFLILYLILCDYDARKKKTIPVNINAVDNNNNINDVIDQV